MSSDKEMEDFQKKIKDDLDSFINTYIGFAQTLPLFKLDFPELKAMIDAENPFSEMISLKLKQISEHLVNYKHVLEDIRTLNRLHSHFLGCLDVASQCEDLLCIKIFISQRK